MNKPACTCKACRGGRPLFCTNFKQMIDDLREFQKARETEILRLTIETENLKQRLHYIRLGMATA